MHDLARLLDVAVGVARDAAALLRDGATGRRSDVTTKTSTTDMVTDMDRAAEALIVEGLAKARPDDAVLGEEGASRPGSSGVRWVVDPLDGTTNYMYGHVGYAVSIAAEMEGRTVVAAVADASRDELFTATVGGGARRDGEPIQVSGESDLSSALVATGFSYLPERRAHQARLLCTVLPTVRDVRRVGAASLDLCSVACGRVDAYYEAGLQPWDLAAGALIAAEAGAAVEGIEGPVPESGSVLASTPALVRPLREALRRAAEPER